LSCFSRDWIFSFNPAAWRNCAGDRLVIEFMGGS
jgi:hypothetical protein